MTPINFCILISHFSSCHPYMFCTVSLPPFSCASFLDDTLSPMFLVSLITGSSNQHTHILLPFCIYLISCFMFHLYTGLPFNINLLEKLFCSHFSNLHSLLSQLVFNPQSSTDSSFEKVLVSSQHSHLTLFCARIIWLLSSIQCPWLSPGRNTFLLFAWHMEYLHGFLLTSIFFLLTSFSNSSISVLIVKPLITSWTGPCLLIFLFASSYNILPLHIALNAHCFLSISHIKTASWIGLLISLVYKLNFDLGACSKFSYFYN